MQWNHQSCVGKIEPDTPFQSKAQARVHFSSSTLCASCGVVIPTGLNVAPFLGIVF